MHSELAMSAYADQQALTRDPKPDSILAPTLDMMPSWPGP